MRDEIDGRHSANSILVPPNHVGEATYRSSITGQWEGLHELQCGFGFAKSPSAAQPHHLLLGHVLWCPV